MSDFDAIRKIPTSLEREYLLKQLVPDRCREHLLIDAPRGFHESLLRSYSIVTKVRELLKQGTPPEVVVELIDLMRSPFPKDEEAA